MSERICPVCGKAFVPKKGKQAYCCRACADKSKHVAVERVCQLCGKHFHVESYEVKRGSGKYCSRSCAAKGRGVMAGLWLKEWGPNPAHVITKVGQCPICGRSLNLTAAPHKRHCSKDCAKQAALLKRIAASSKALSRCRECGQEFLSEYGDKHRVFCSDTCGRKHHDRLAKAKRNERVRDRWVAHVHPLEIAERDGWRCQLCGRKVKRGVVAPHPLAMTMDHIVPLARGGMHEPANVQLAHFICNSRKGATVGEEQLRLIG